MISTSRIISALIILSFSVSGILSSAQTTPLTANDIRATIDPATPQALSTITIKLQSNKYDLADTFVSWLVNDKLQDQGEGRLEYDLTLGPVGMETVVTALLETPEGQEFKKEFRFNPGQVDIIWEANTYTPPLYRGKALPTAGSTIKLTALPSFRDSKGKVLDPKNLNYDWRVNNNLPDGGQGRGIQRITLTTNRYYQATTVSVRVSVPKTNMSVETKVSIPPSQPLVRFYEDRPLAGTQYHLALGPDLLLRQPTLIMKAEPFYFNLVDIKDEKLKYRWTVNNQLVASSTNSNLLHLERPVGSGENIVAFQVLNSNDVLQQAKAAVTIRFSSSL